MIYNLFIPSLIAVVFFSSGCYSVRDISAGADLQNATEVSISQLKEATKDEIFFRWWGSDDKFHYFESKKGFYRMPTKFDMSNFKRVIDQKHVPGRSALDVLFDGGSIVPWKGNNQAPK